MQIIEDLDAAQLKGCDATLQQSRMDQIGIIGQDRPDRIRRRQFANAGLDPA